MLNQRDPKLDLLPEELALTVQDFEYGFENWSYTGSAPGLYGYESYAQYGNFDIIKQELSKGHTVGMSVRYASYKNGSYPYLETGAANSTGGHLITLTGFYYDEAIDNYVYYSSDPATPNDYIASGEHRQYQEKHLKEASSYSKTNKSTTVSPPPALENKIANFIDINSDMWYYDAVKYVVDNNIMKGTSETLFSPNAFLTREMAVTILYRYANEPGIFNIADYSDVKSSDYFYNAVSWAIELGIVKGYGNKIFGTGNNLTREDFVVILYRYAKSRGMNVLNNSDLLKYADSNQISPWAVEALEWANAIGLIVGKTNTSLAPKDALTRAELKGPSPEFTDSASGIRGPLQYCFLMNKLRLNALVLNALWSSHNLQ